MVLESGSTTNWTLAKDQKLRKELERISESILQRASHSSQRCKEASNIVETKLIELDLLINNLERISTVQFVENRVAEDSSDAQTSEENAKSATQDGDSQDIGKQGFDLFDKVKESLKVATASFEQMEGESEGRVDVLPSVIGTEEYVTNKYCGLEAIYGFGESEEDHSGARTSSGDLPIYDGEYMQQGIDDTGVSGVSAFGSDPFGTSASADPFASESVGMAPPPPPPPPQGLAMAPPTLAVQDANQSMTKAKATKPTREKRVSGLHAQSRESTATATAIATATAPSASQDPFAVPSDEIMTISDDPFGNDEVEGATSASVSAKPKSTYALSFDDIFGDDDGKDSNTLSTDNLFGPLDTTTTTMAQALGSEQSATGMNAESMDIPKAKPPASNLQASLAKILTESPSVGLFDESQNLKIAKREGGDDGTSQTDKAEEEKSERKELDVFKGEHGFASTSSRALPGIPTFANEIAQKGGKSRANLVDSILSESPSVGLFEEDKLKEVISQGESEEAKQESSPGRALGDGNDAQAPVVPNTRSSISVRDPFALARAKNQSDSDSDSGSFSSSDDFDEDSDSEGPPSSMKQQQQQQQQQANTSEPKEKKTAVVEEEGPLSATVSEADPFSFGTESSALGSNNDDTPAKLPQATTKKEKVNKTEVENPFSSSSSGLFGDDDDDGGMKEITETKKEKEEASPFSSNDAFAGLFGTSSTSSRPKSSSLFEDPDKTDDVKQPTAKDNPFGGSDLFSSSSKTLFETSEKEKKISKGLFDDFLDDSGDKSGGGLFD